MLMDLNQTLRFRLRVHEHSLCDLDNIYHVSRHRPILLHPRDQVHLDLELNRPNHNHVRTQQMLDKLCGWDGMGVLRDLSYGSGYL